MNTFTVVCVTANPKLVGLIERESEIKSESIHSIIGFDEDSVYNGNTQRLTGIFVVTGPVPTIHVFTRVGLTYKYRGFSDKGPYGGVWVDANLGDFLNSHHAKQFSAFQNCLGSVMDGVIATVNSK